MNNSIYSYLQHPLVLVGAVLFCLLGIFKLLLNSGILFPPAQKEVAPILHKVLNYGFVLAVIVSVSGFGLEYFKIYKQIDQIKQAKQSIAVEVLSNVSNIDERLGYVQKTLEPDTFHQHLDSVRNKIIPNLSLHFQSDYSRLIMEQKITSFRQMLNSSPLRTGAGRSELENLHRSGIDAEKYHMFYNQLAEVERVTEAFLSTLAYTVSMSEKPSNLQTEYSKNRLELSVRNLKVESQIAHVLALQVLHEVAAPPHPITVSESVLTTLQALKYLKPRKPLAPKEANKQLAGLIEQKAKIVAQEALLVENGKKLSREKLKNYEEIEELLKITSSDTWSQVVGKAISLRQLGRRAESLAAFSRYADMFTATDPTAKEYARIAQQFTTQLDLLGVQGGAYLYEVKSGSMANQAGLRKGDIIIAYNGSEIADMTAFVEASKSALASDSILITWLRINKQNKFNRYSKNIPGGSLGAGIMPI